MHPISFVKAHPVGVGVSMLAGMMIGPWVLSKISGATGVNVSVPTYGGQG